MRPPPVPNRSPTTSAAKLTRRRLLGWTGLAVALVSGAAGYQRAQQPQGPVRDREQDVLPLLSSAPATAPTGSVISPSPAPLPTVTPVGPVVFYRGGIASDPRSHDFNADERCGGVPDLFAGLVALTPDYEPVPDWAQAWQSSADGRRWVFTLRRNRSGWSNGDPVRAQDFVWSWQRMLMPETNAPQAPLLFDIVNARAVHQQGVDPALLGIHALDDWTIELELEQPRSYFPVLLGLPGLLPAHRPSVERWGERWTEAGRCVSNGPFQLAAWEHGRFLVLERNPYYWNNGMQIDRCVLPILAPDQALIGFFRGDLDLTAVAAESLSALVLDPVLGGQLARSVEPAIWMLIPNVQRPPFDERAVRRALGPAIDRVRLWQLSYGAVVPARCLVPPGLAGHLEADDVLLAGQRFDPAGSRRLLEQVLTADPDAWPPVTLDVPPGLSQVERVLVDDLLQQLASNLQIPLTLRELTAHEWEAALTRGDFHLLWLRWDFPYPDPSAAYAALFERERRRIRGLGWSDADYDSLVRLGDRETDRLRRLAIYRQCERILQEHGVYVPIGYPVSPVLVKPWVRTLPRNRRGEPVGPNRLFSRVAWYVSLGERARG